MSIFVLYIHHPEQGLYSYVDLTGCESWLELTKNVKACRDMETMFLAGWVPKACEVVYDRVAISTGQTGITARINDLVASYGICDFRPLWPQKSAEIKWKEGQKLPVEVWTTQDRSSIDFSKITQDLCKGSTGSSYL